MKVIIFLVIIFPFGVFAKTGAYKLALSPTFNIEIPFKIASNANLPSLDANYFKLSIDNNGSTELYAIHNQPKTFANKFSIERYWNDSRKQTSSIDKNEKNLGCKKLTSRTYKCFRSVGQNGKFISESLFWNTKYDLVLLRATSISSFEQSKKILDSLKINQVSRIPAGGKKWNYFLPF